MSSARQIIHRAFGRLDLKDEEIADAILEHQPEALQGLHQNMQELREKIEVRFERIEVHLGVMEWTQRLTVILLLALFWAVWRLGGGT